MENQSFKEGIINQIKSGKVKMKPKLYFILRPILFVFALIMILVFLIYFLSFLFFIFRINDGWALTGFGLRGVMTLFLSMPWGIISFILLFIVIIETLVFRFGPMYRKPMLYSLFGLVVFVLVLSFLIALTSFHDNMLSSNKKGRLPWMSPLYMGYERINFRNVHCGKVLGVTDNGFVVEYMDDPSCKEIKIEVPPDFNKHKNLEIGDIVILAGRRDGSIMKLIDLTQKDSQVFCNHQVRTQPVPILK